MKKKVSITIDQQVFNEAKSRGINVSRACENYLKLLNSTINTNPNLPGEEKVRLPGFEPGSSTWQGGPTTVDWVKFEDWLKAKKYRGSGTSTKLSYATRYHGFLFRGELGKLSELSPDSRANALKALSSLSKFLGCHEQFKKQMKDYGLMWTGKSADQLFVDRLTKVQNPAEIFSWIREVKQVRPWLSEFLDLMAISGLRMVEAVESYNLIVKLSDEKKLETYYNEANNSLEHYRFKELFLRKSKKAFVSFMPQMLLNDIAGSVRVSSATAISKALRREGLKPRFADIRENHGSYMTKFLKESEINFLHGRVSNGVFMQHYFNPALISDLRARVFQGIAEIQEKIK